MKNIYTLLSILIISLTVYLSFDDLMPSSVKSIESTGFSEYFKNENEFFEKLDAKQLDLTYNR